MQSLQALGVCQLLAPAGSCGRTFSGNQGSLIIAAESTGNGVCTKRQEREPGALLVCSQQKDGEGRNHGALTGALAWQQDAECLSQDKQMFEFPQS